MQSETSKLKNKLKWEPKVSKSVLNLAPYVPGKPIEETEREYGIKGVIKLASNENPLGPSPLAVQAIAAKAQEGHRYPDAAHFSLKKALSKYHGLSADSFVVGNGSNELIDLIIRIFVPAGSNVVAPEYSFVAYKLCAALQGCGYKEAPVGKNFELSVKSILKTVNAKTRVVFLANPNNPTGAHLRKEEVESLAAALDKKKILLVLDYAYWEYVQTKDIPSPEHMVQKFSNVIVLKTFSKIHGLAAFRVGYSISHERLADILNRSRQPFNINSYGLIAAEAALWDKTFVAKSLKTNNEGLKVLQKSFQDLPGVKLYPTQGNFILIGHKQDSLLINEEFLKRGVIIRPVRNYGLKNHIRISVGTTEENERLVKAAKEIFGRK